LRIALIVCDQVSSSSDRKSLRRLMILPETMKTPSPV
jgi:hypothetical protein